MCTSVWEGGWATLQSQMPASRSFTSVKKVAQWCTVAHMVSSLRTEAVLICLLFASSHSMDTLKHTNGCHLQAVTTCSEMFYGDFIKICFYKSHVGFLKFFDEVWAVCVSRLYLARSVSMQNFWNITFAFLCHSVKRDKYERPCGWAIKKKIPCEEHFLPRRYISDSLSWAVAGALQS